MFENPAFLIVMQEFLPKGNFFDFIYPKNRNKNTFTEDETFYIFKQLLDILEEVHSKDRTLFSIQPENLYFSNSSFVVSHLTNSRILQILKGQQTHLNIYYASPILLQEKRITKEIDFWQLGILVYECLYGVTPFQQESHEETKNLILSSDIYFPPDKIKATSEEVKNLIKFLLNKEPEF